MADDISQSMPSAAHLPRAGSSSTRRAPLRLRRYSVGQFLAVLILVFIATPFMEEMANGRLVEAIVLSLVLGSAVLAVRGPSRTLAWPVALVIPALAAKWLDHFWPGAIPSVLITAVGLLFVAFIIFRLFAFIRHAPRVDSEVLCAGVAAYLMLALLWAMAYTLVFRLDPAAFTHPAGPAAARGMEGLNSLYFSVMTLATVGYGDITPVSGPARMLAMLESMTGIFYIALLISRLVSMYSRERQAESGSSRHP
jgi:hypothetical protein